MSATFGIVRLILLVVVSIVLLVAWYHDTPGLDNLRQILFGLVAIIGPFLIWFRNPESMDTDRRWKNWMKIPEADRARTLSIAAIISAVIFPIVGPLFGLLLLRRHSTDSSIVRNARRVCITVIVLTLLFYVAWITF